MCCSTETPCDGWTRGVGVYGQSDVDKNRTEAFALDWMVAAHDFSVLVVLVAGEGNSIMIENVWAWPADTRKRAEETSALIMLCHLADVHQVTLRGFVESYDKRLEEAISLRLWLSHHGFRPSTEEGLALQLFRQPKKVAIAAANA
jgi:hypothetical protein